VIPTVLVLAALIGRWWFVAVAAVAWPVVLFVDGSCDLSCAPSALGLAGVNAGLGVLVHKGVVWGYRHRPRLH
jgi:hypothetical protein